ncbi:MAG TPA: hypothetical protein VEX86_26210 [Longimicrobium sp.]|nr:hypothetical protein [Longimicrobium sp.]
MALREFRDSAGVQWRAWSVQPSSFVAPSIAGQPADAERPGWLCFECRSEKRRLIPAPEGWDARSDAELDELRRTADVVPRSSDCAPPRW